MRKPFLFEFMDLARIPESLRLTIRDVLEICLGKAPRRYYPWVTDQILQIVRQKGIRVIQELGAGTAAVSRHLATTLRDRGEHTLVVRISDLHPDPVLYRSLEAEFPGLIEAVLSPIDLTAPMSPDSQTLLVISGSFHHIPFHAREKSLKSLIQHHVAIFEPLRRNAASFLISVGGLFPGIAAPVIYMIERRAGHWRRFLWCWVLPVVPLIIVWEGWVSCWRCWTEKEWRRAFAATAGKDDARLEIELLPLSQRISW